MDYGCRHTSCDRFGERQVPPAIPSCVGDYAILLRGHLDTAAIPGEVREQQVQSVDPTLPVFGAHALNETVSESLAERRFSMEMISE